MARDARNDLSRKYIKFVRDLANHSRLGLFHVLMKEVESISKKKQAPPDLAEDILDKLKYQIQDVDMLFAVSLKNKAIRTDVERHNITSAYTAIRDALSKPFIRLPEIHDSKSTTSNDSIDSPNPSASELGLMIRAPIAVLATIPLVLGSFVWPWLVHVSSTRLALL